MRRGLSVTTFVSVAVLVCCVTAGSAAAGVVSVGSEPSSLNVSDGPKIVYRANPGESNQVLIQADQEQLFGNAGRAIVSDPAGVRAGNGCQPLDTPTRAVCDLGPTGRIGFFEISLNDRNDLATVVGTLFAHVKLVGGPGDDVLNGAQMSENLFIGGPGNDKMVGGTRIDVFDEGARRNGSDTLDGHEETDWADYSARRRSLNADLIGDRDDGEAGERDRIVAVEGLVGGAGADRLSGTARVDYLSGGPGSDVLKGGAGNDLIVGGWRFARRVSASAPAHDRLFGGDGGDIVVGSPGGSLIVGGRGADRLRGDRGRDRILAGDRIPDDVHCGGGRDVLRHDPFDLEYSCERHDPSSHGAVPLGLVSDHGLSPSAPDDYTALQVGCPASGGSECVGTARLELDGTTVASTNFRVRAAQSWGQEYMRTSDEVWQMIRARDPRLWVVVSTYGRAGPPVRVQVSQLAPYLGESINAPELVGRLS
jgi:hypothetical protein